MEYLNSLITNISIYKKEWEIIVSISTLAMTLFSLCVALAALYISRAQLRSQASNDRLMAHPHLDSNHIIDDESQKYYFQIENNGIGPAIIIRTELYFKNSRIDSEDPVDTVMKMIINERQGTIHSWGHHKIALGSYLRPGTAIDLISIEFAQDGQQHTATQLHHYLEKSAHLMIWYRSIHNQYYLFDSDISPLAGLKPLNFIQRLRLYFRK